MTNISAVIVAKDNPPHLLETIESIADIAHEIVIVDIGLASEVISKLNSLQKIKIVKEAGDVRYVEQIREKTKEYISSEYMLILDPDEIIPNELKTLLLNEYQKFDYISIPRKNIILGKWIQHSRWWPDYQVRLFKKDKVVWQQKLHEQPQLLGNGLKIDPKEELALIHYNYENLTEYFEKMVRYAKSEAQELVDRKEPYTIRTAIKNALHEFMSRYFASQGYKDGMHGFVLSFLQMFYSFIVYFYYWELTGYKEDTQAQSTIQTFFKQGLFESNYWMEKEGQSRPNLKNKILNKLLK